MKLKFLFLFILLSTALFAQKRTVFQLDSANAVELNKWEHYFTRDTSWTPFNKSDIEWKPGSRDTLFTNQKGIQWFKTDFQFQGRQKSGDLVAFWIFNFSFAYELYWDGILLKRNGRPSIDEKTEKSGKVHQLILISQKNTEAGDHQLVLKTSNCHWINRKLVHVIRLGYHSSFISLFKRGTSLQNRILSIYLLTLLICIVLYLGGIKNSTLLYFGSFAGIIFLYYCFEHAISLGIINFHQYQWMEIFWEYFTTIAFILLFLLVFYYFEKQLKKRHVIMAGLFLLLMTTAGFLWDLFLWIQIGKTIFAGLLFVIILTQLKKKIPGSRFLLLASIMQLLIYGDRFFRHFFQHHIIFHPRLINQVFAVSYPALILVAIIFKVSDQYHRFKVISIKTRQLEKELQKQKSRIHYIVCRERNENRLIPVQEIQYFKAERFLVEVHLLRGDTELVEKPLNKLEEILPDHFLRIHRSFIVNLQQVDSYRSVSGGLYEMYLKDGNVLPVSRSRVKKLNLILKK